ncbi:MAG: EAL domain-containing protein [Actinomycetota bacterium]
MTEHRRRPSQTLTVDERPLIPSVPLRGARETLDRPVGSPASAPVDGVAMIFVDPSGGDAHIVFASEGLASMMGRRTDELLGRDPGELFAVDGHARFAEVRRGLALERERLADQRAIADIRPLIAGDRFEPAQTGQLHPGQVHPDQLHPDQVRAGLGDTGPAIDLDADDPGRSLALGTELLRRHGRRHQDAPPRVYAAAQELARAGGRPLSVHAAYTTVPSMTPLAPYVVAEFRNLEQPSAERLLADQEAVIRSLGRGHELGRVCHQVAAQVEQELADGSRCWVAVRSGDGRLEPVLTGGLPFELVEGIVGDLLELGQPLARRVVAIGALPPERLAQLGSAPVASLWYLPLVDEGAEDAESSEGDPPAGRAGERPDATEPPARSGPDALRGALVVATPRSRPTRAQARALEHLAAVLDTAVEQATVEADLVHRALHDPLTGLPNRALLVDRLGQVMARLERDDLALSVLLVDIDRFKSVNDTRGADVGDEVLQEVAGRLLTAVRLGDTVGRLAGDQYLVMCAAGKEELDATAVARRILRSLAEPIAPSDGGELHLTASIGLVVVDAPGATPAAIISNAESALARATAAGRGRMAIFEADQGRDGVDRHVLEQSLYRAIGAGELVIHYQPLVEIRTGFMTGAEALIRWNRPGHGLVGPGAFIPIAEESDLIVAVGTWIIDRVCQDLTRWPKSRGRSPMVTINLGSRQLADDTLVPTVISALHRHGLRPRRLGFEITESVEIRDAEAAVANLNRLKDLGCRIAIDDFGIGYATLDYIRRFSMADALKIDKSFINGLGQSREDTAIVDASIALASSLGLQVIAEGVEELDQLDGLLERGARYAQGFALAKPVPFELAIELWGRQRLYDPPWDQIDRVDTTEPAAPADAVSTAPPPGSPPAVRPTSPLPGGDLVIDLDGPVSR